MCFPLPTNRTSTASHASAGLPACWAVPSVQLHRLGYRRMCAPPAVIACLCGVLFAFSGACSNQVLPPGAASDDTSAGRVFLFDVEGLDPPEIGPPTVYHVRSLFPIEPEAGDSPLATAFVLTVVSDGESQLGIRLWADGGDPIDLLADPQPYGQPAAWDGPAWVADNDAARQALLDGHGAFASIGSESSQAGMRDHLGVVLAEGSFTSTARLVVYGDQLDGIAIGGAELRVAREFFYFGVAGDSIAWGNGLRRAAKIPALVQTVIESELGVHVVEQNFSQTNATILPGPFDMPCTTGCWGEVPRTPTSVATQVTLFERPELMDLVLINGCINDIGIDTVLDPFIDPDVLGDWTVAKCERPMADLIEEVKSVAPNAAIVVLGFYPIVSEQSELFGVSRVTEILADEPVPIWDGLVDALAESSRVFAEQANAALDRAIAEVRKSDTDMKVALAIPAFGAENAVFAPESWLWNLTPTAVALPGLDVNLSALPEDPIADLRWKACFEREQLSGLVLCLLASVGHPRPEGAQAYAGAVVSQLRTLGVLPDAGPE